MHTCSAVHTPTYTHAQAHTHLHTHVRTFSGKTASSIIAENVVRMEGGKFRTNATKGVSEALLVCPKSVASDDNPRKNTSRLRCKLISLPRLPSHMSPSPVSRSCAYWNALAIGLTDIRLESRSTKSMYTIRRGQRVTNCMSHLAQLAASGRLG